MLLFERNNTSAFVLLYPEKSTGIAATNRKHTGGSVSEAMEAGWGSERKECGLWSQADLSL